MVSSFLFFSLSIIDLTTKAEIFAPNTFLPSKKLLTEKEKLTLEDSLREAYMQNANQNAVFNEYTEQTIDKSGFYLRIDKIGLFKAIVKDVDPRSKETYVASWKKGISHGKFTAYPDEIGLTYLFAHAIGDETRAEGENAWFSNMDNVVIGDQIIIYFSNVKYVYEVSEIKVVSPDATGFYTGVSPVQKVRLQFCGPPTGSLAKRTLIDALLVEEVQI